MAQDGIEDDVEDIVDPAAFPYRCILLMCLIISSFPRELQEFRPPTAPS